MAIFSLPRPEEIDNTLPSGTSENPNFDLVTPANIITLARMILTVIFLLLFVAGTHRYLAVGIYAIAASTDWLDGQIARRTQTVSWYGKILDPICDRVLLFCGVLALVLTGELPVWVAIFLIGRDIYLACGAKLIQRYQKRPLDVVYMGKVATALLMFGFCDLLLGWPYLNPFNLVDISVLPLLNHIPGCLGLLFVYVGCICSFITACIYTKNAVLIALTHKRID